MKARSTSVETRVGLVGRKVVLRQRLPQHLLRAPVPGDQPGLGLGVEDGAHGGAADAERRRQLRLRRQGGAGLQHAEAGIVGLLEDGIALAHADHACAVTPSPDGAGEHSRCVIDNNPKA